MKILGIFVSIKNLKSQTALTNRLHAFSNLFDIGKTIGAILVHSESVNSNECIIQELGTQYLKSSNPNSENY